MRSLLFVPAHDNRKCDKGLLSGADALILDLEDAVPPAEKALARQRCADFVARHRERMRLFVRINALATGEALADLDAIVPAAPYGLMLPKCERGRDVARLQRCNQHHTRSGARGNPRTALQLAFVGTTRLFRDVVRGRRRAHTILWRLPKLCDCSIVSSSAQANNDQTRSLASGAANGSALS